VGPRGVTPQRGLTPPRGSDPLQESLPTGRGALQSVGVNPEVGQALIMGSGEGNKLLTYTVVADSIPNLSDIFTP